jgi:thioredoxin
MATRLSLRSMAPHLLAVVVTVASASVNAGCADAGSAEGSPAGSSQSARPVEAAAAAAHPHEISFGDPVELTEHLVAGDITVFDFTSEYCPPCRQIAPWLERLHAERSGVSVVKVNINRPQKRGIDWGSPVARQFGLQSIPAFMVYDAQGKVMAKGEQAKVLVIGWLQELSEEDSTR